MGSIRRSKNTEYMTPPNACPDNTNPVTSPFLSLKCDNAARIADYLKKPLRIPRPSEKQITKVCGLYLMNEQ